MLKATWRNAFAIALAVIVLAAGVVLRVTADVRPGPGMAASIEGSIYSLSLITAGVGLLLLVGGIWWLGGALPDERLRALAIPLASAAAIPYFAVPLQGAATVPEGVVPYDAARVILLGTFVAIALADLLVADALVAMVADRRLRSAVGFLAIGGAAVASSSAAWVLSYDVAVDPLAIRWWACLVILLVPALVAMWTRRASSSPGVSVAGDPGGAWVIAAACTPALALLQLTADASQSWGMWYLPALWIAMLVVWRTVARRLIRSRRMRDLVVAATEAERARLAADLHDVALQELTLLVRHLDEQGDEAGGELARGVSERLRDLCGDLHLPILDELGAGPALDWLVHRVADATQEDIRLERSDEIRPPSSVELAMFRIAQEALSNAVKHGRPPVVVRYSTGRSAATLTIDDAGPGITLTRGEMAARPGHFGMATMQQRAEQIGAMLSVRAWPGGGTRVGVEWRS